MSQHDFPSAGGPFAGGGELGALMRAMDWLQTALGAAQIECRSQEPPRIHVGASRRDRSWEFSVRDNGIGEKLVEAYRGRIRVESKPGDGATFFFTMQEGE